MRRRYGTGAITNKEKDKKAPKNPSDKPPEKPAPLKPAN
jgi:hypothetical protein